MCANLLEVPAQLVDRLGLDRRQELIPHDLFRALGNVRELRRHDDPERPYGQCPEQRGVTFEEHSELVQPWVGDDVDDHAAAGEVNADRQAVREVPNGANPSLADANVRQIARRHNLTDRLPDDVRR